MTISFATLITPTTSDAVLSSLLTALQGAGFPTTTWQKRSVPRGLLQASSTTYASVSNAVSAIATLGLLSLSFGDFLTVLAHELFEVDRNLATATQGQMVLDDSSSPSGPFTIAVGDLTAVGPGGQTYRNSTSGTLTRGGSLTLSWTATNPGAAGNLATLSSMSLSTPLGSVVVTNPAIGSTGTWITTQGSDTEEDVDLQSRCRAKWSTLGAGGTDATYEYYARLASAEVVKVRVLPHYPSGGKVTTVVSGADGPVSSTALSAAQALIQSRAPNVVQTFVVNAVSTSVTTGGTVSVLAAKRATAMAAWSSALAAYGATLKIGDIVRVSKLIELLMDIDGVVDVSISSPASNVSLASNAIAVFTDALTWLSV